MNDAGRFSALTLDAVERRYGRAETTVEVLNGASLTLYSGQSVALIAPSGAGKSTLLHLAGLLERPSAGEVTVAGKATSAMTDDERTGLRRNQIGFVYQFHHLLPEFSALENLVLPQMIAGLPRAEAASARARTPRLSWPRRARNPSPGRALRRRAAARRHCAGGRQRPAHPARRRADRQSRPQDRRPRLRNARRARQSHRPRRPHRHSQPRACRPHGPPRDDPRRAGGGDGVGGNEFGLDGGLTPIESRKARKIAIVRDPHAASLNCQRRKPSVRDERATNRGLQTYSSEYRPVPRPGTHDLTVWLVQEIIAKGENFLDWARLDVDARIGDDPG